MFFFLNFLFSITVLAPVWRNKLSILQTMAHNICQLEMWANAQRDGRPAEYRWRPLFNAAKSGWRPLLECHANPLKFAGVPQTRQQMSAASRPKFTILWGMWRCCCLNVFFRLSIHTLVVKIYRERERVYIARQSCGMVPTWRLFGDFLRVVFSASRAQHVSVLHSKFTLRPHHVRKYG